MDLLRGYLSIGRTSRNKKQWFSVYLSIGRCGRRDAYIC
jgi:hypothetical protein